MKFFLLVLSLTILLTGCKPADSSESQAAAYCLKNAGIAETRYPLYDTNSQKPLQLEGSLQVCTFKANDQTRISIDVNSLYTDKPTLAALAYLSRTSAAGLSPRDYCSKLGGSDRFGLTNGVEGGWGTTKSGGDVIALCVFPDQSMIDSQALTDHANWITKGADLEPLLRYKLDQSRKPFQ